MFEASTKTNRRLFEHNRNRQRSKRSLRSHTVLFAARPFDQDGLHRRVIDVLSSPATCHPDFGLDEDRVDTRAVSGRRSSPPALGLAAPPPARNVPLGWIMLQKDVTRQRRG